MTEHPDTCPSLCVERSHPGREHDPATDGCYCWELCGMGPTCPGANAGLPRGCWRTLPTEPMVTPSADVVCSKCGLWYGLAARDRRVRGEALLPVRRYAEAQAVTNRARFGFEGRPWLDLLAILDRADRIEADA